MQNSGANSAARTTWQLMTSYPTSLFWQNPTISLHVLHWPFKANVHVDCCGSVFIGEQLQWSDLVAFD
jgi:hypothetical protein